MRILERCAELAEYASLLAILLLVLWLLVRHLGVRSRFPRRHSRSVLFSMGTARFDTVMSYSPRGVDIAIRSHGCRRVRYMRADELGDVSGLATRRASLPRLMLRYRE